MGTNWTIKVIGGVSGFNSNGSADGAGSDARFYSPSDVEVDSAGNVYVADSSNHTIRKGAFTAYGAAQSVTYNPPAMTGKLVVTLLPPQANGQWRFPWELGWHNSGETVSNLAQANYPVEFRSVPGWLSIQTNFTVTVLTNATAYATNQYYPTLSDGVATAV
ncbi:MAG: hypothetical protein WDM76_18350 [Limisphaerales bacterium]